MMIVVEDNITYGGRKAVYNTKTDELLVFAKGDNIYYDLWDYREFDGGMYYALESDGAYNKLCVITERGSQNEIKPEPDNSDERSRHLAELKKKFDVEIPMGYVEDNFDIQSYTYMVYDIINNKLFVYEEGLNCDVWLSDGTGAAFSYGYFVSDDTYKINKISIFTAK